MGCDLRINHAAENAAIAYTYTGDNLTTIVVTLESGETLTRTLSYTGSQLDSMSKWVQT